MELPADLKWTPERASKQEILTAYRGRFVSKGPRFAALRFADVGHAGAWAGATDMTARVSFAQPVTDLVSEVSVRLDYL